VLRSCITLLNHVKPCTFPNVTLCRPFRAHLRGPTRHDWDFCLYGDLFMNYPNDIYEQFNEIEQLLTPADNVNKWPNMLMEQSLI
jgi:hypothetical protein